MTLEDLCFPNYEGQRYHKNNLQQRYECLEVGMHGSVGCLSFLEVEG